MKQFLKNFYYTPNINTLVPNKVLKTKTLKHSLVIKPILCL